MTFLRHALHPGSKTHETAWLNANVLSHESNLCITLVRTGYALKQITATDEIKSLFAWCNSEALITRPGAQYTTGRGEYHDRVLGLHAVGNLNNINLGDGEYSRGFSTRLSPWIIDTSWPLVSSLLFFSTFWRPSDIRQDTLPRALKLLTCLLTDLTSKKNNI